MFLSFFQIAGSLGNVINAGLSQFFGFDRFIVPLVLIMIGATLAYPERGTFSTWNLLGLFFFFLSFNAILNLLLVNKPDPFTQNLSSAGGYLGQFLGLILPAFVGYWGSIVVTIAVLFISIMLVFNTSLHHLSPAHIRIFDWFGRMIGKGEVDKKDEEAQEVEEAEEAGEVEEAEEEDEPHEFHATPVKTNTKLETLLATKQRRQITIPLTLLDRSTSKAQSGDIERNKQIIEKTFHEFGIDVEMGNISVGPTVTQYTLRPAQGIKLARIVSLQNDLALALAAHPIRLEAPIPGKSLVGIEVPNTKVATVTLRDVIETKSYREWKGALAVPLGKDVSGGTCMISIDKMPHLLVAGATGSGKSVCLNTIILSLLFQYGPDDLKLILVDPKRVELTAYAGIPHLLVPPIVGVDDTVNALKWTVREMERRLDMLSKFGARNIDDYNSKVDERMPKIIILIDELADLMSASGREVEATIVRIAQMARAVGIHLVLATQRPSVDVITGLIKANIPGRIAFAVASQTDSRTILDQSGAEKLLGRGDMLFTSAELSKPKRLQGAFVSSDEVERVVGFLRKKGEPDYNLAITEITKAGTVFNNPEDGDPMLEECVQVVLQSGKASTSLLQRRLRIGYSRAARIMDLLEQAGVIGPPDGSRPREVLIDEWPPGGNIKEGMPIAQDDYEEAWGGKEEKEKEEEEEMEERKEDVAEGFSGLKVGSAFGGSLPEVEEAQEKETDWENKIDDEWIK
ncbi:DNA translocase FtsK 4TM domain-containing protein [Candidatus Falkowbacteria bacterium]|nr:DNA translocase FtsK 4TM domain-containing protein [Candidatus Falkowbacteria bacterium]